jgi:hypothetical protein
MMATAPHPHEVLLQQVQGEFAELLNQTTQGIYIYQDDPHWICNEVLATMLGYGSAKELLKAASGSLLDTLVSAESQKDVVAAYMGTVNGKVASAIPVTWKKKGGGSLKTQTIFAPFSFKGNLLSIHFVTPL